MQGCNEAITEIPLGSSICQDAVACWWTSMEIQGSRRVCRQWRLDVADVQVRCAKFHSSVSFVVDP
jgi:hypothetical protein